MFQNPRHSIHLRGDAPLPLALPRDSVSWDFLQFFDRLNAEQGYFPLLCVFS